MWNWEPANQKMSSLHRTNFLNSTSITRGFGGRHRWGRRTSITLSMEFDVDGKVSDGRNQFGIREVKSEVSAANHRLFSINGKKHPDPRRRLVFGHDAAREPPARGRRIPLRAGHGAEHRSPGGQAGDPGIFRSRRPQGHPDHGGLVLLRSSGSTGPSGSRRISPSRNSRCATRCTGCAAIPAW